MPEFDAAAHRDGVRERTEMLTRGWPDLRDWEPAPAVLAVLEQLCTARREACDYSWRAVTDPAPPQVAETYAALVAGLVDAGLPRRLAEFSTDATRTLDWMSVVECVRWVAAGATA